MAGHGKDRLAQSFRQPVRRRGVEVLGVGGEGVVEAVQPAHPGGHLEGLLGVVGVQVADTHLPSPPRHPRGQPEQARPPPQASPVLALARCQGPAQGTQQVVPQLAAPGDGPGGDEAQVRPADRRPAQGQQPRRAVHRSLDLRRGAVHDAVAPAGQWEDRQLDAVPFQRPELVDQEGLRDHRIGVDDVPDSAGVLHHTRLRRERRRRPWPADRRSCGRRGSTRRHGRKCRGARPTARRPASGR